MKDLLRNRPFWAALLTVAASLLGLSVSPALRDAAWALLQAITGGAA